MTNYNLSEIMRRAWGYRDTMSMAEAMKKSWEEAKYTLENLIEAKKELLSQIEEIDKMILLKTENVEDNEYTFEFNHEEDSRKGYPYVARMSINEEGKLDRSFVNNFHKSYEKQYVRVFGKYTAKEGEIIEIQKGALSWKKKDRAFFIVEKGELKQFADQTDKKKVIDYLDTIGAKNED